MKYTSLVLLINLFYTSNSYPEEFGEKIYQDSCANCHENELLRAPNFAALKLIGKEGLLNSLTNGSMQEVGNTLKEEELIEDTRSIIAAYKLPKSVIFADEVQRAPNGKANYKWAKSFAEEHLS